MQVIGVAVILAGIGVGWATMIYGWGLDPSNWPWIIFGTAGNILLAGLGQALIALDK